MGVREGGVGGRRRCWFGGVEVEEEGGGGKGLEEWDVEM